MARLRKAPHGPRRVRADFLLVQYEWDAPDARRVGGCPPSPFGPLGDRSVAAKGRYRSDGRPGSSSNGRIIDETWCPVLSFSHPADSPVQRSAGRWRDTAPSGWGAAIGAVAGAAGGVGVIKLIEEIDPGGAEGVGALALYGLTHGLVTGLFTRVF